MHGGLTSTGTPGLPLLAALLTLLALPLLLLPLGTASGGLDNWLRDPFLQSAGTHPPSWPRRHLMLSVLRHSKIFSRGSGKPRLARFLPPCLTLRPGQTGPLAGSRAR